jgi:hypothetical protein
VSAAGYYLPPMDRKTYHQLSLRGGKDGHGGFLSMRLAPGLVMDGHSSYYCPETIHMATKDQALLDKGPFKSAWKTTVHEYMMKNPVFLGSSMKSRIFS